MENVVIRTASRPREGWDEKFRTMAESGDDAMLDHDTPAQTKWDEDEWEW